MLCPLCEKEEVEITWPEGVCETCFNDTFAGGHSQQLMAVLAENKELKEKLVKANQYLLHLADRIRHLRGKLALEILRKSSKSP